MYSERHRLLEPQHVGDQFSNATEQRAFISWTHLGQVNKYSDVCRFYHYLEELESTYEPEKAAASRKLEFDLLAKDPPTSPFLLEYFPNLYPKKTTETAQPSTTNNQPSGATPEAIMSTSKMIREYCRSNNTSVHDFLHQFKDYATEFPLNPTLSNIAFYIQHRTFMEQRNRENGSNGQNFAQRTNNEVELNRPSTSGQQGGAATVLYNILNSVHTQPLCNKPIYQNEPSTSYIITEIDNNADIETDNACQNNNNVSTPINEAKSFQEVLEQSRTTLNSTNDFLKGLQNMNIADDSEKENNPAIKNQKNKNKSSSVEHSVASVKSYKEKSSNVSNQMNVLNSRNTNSDVSFDSECLNLSHVYPGSVADTSNYSNLSEDFERLNKRYTTSSQ